MERIKTMRTMAIALALSALMMTGCKNQSTTTTAASHDQVAVQADTSPEALGELGAQIKKQPKDAQRLLSEHGLTEQSFEKAIRKVSEDPAASKRYAEAYKRAGA